MFKAHTFEVVDGSVDDGDRAFPLTPTIPVLNSSAAPPDADTSVRETGLFMKITAKDTARVIPRRDFVPTCVTKEPIVQGGRAFMLELVTLQIVATTDDAEASFASDRASMTGA